MPGILLECGETHRDQPPASPRSWALMVIGDSRWERFTGRGGSRGDAKHFPCLGFGSEQVWKSHGQSDHGAEIESDSSHANEEREHASPRCHPSLLHERHRKPISPAPAKSAKRSTHKNHDQRPARNRMGKRWKFRRAFWSRAVVHRCWDGVGCLGSGDGEPNSNGNHHPQDTGNREKGGPSGRSVETERGRSLQEPKIQWRKPSCSSSRLGSSTHDQPAMHDVACKTH